MIQFFKKSKSTPASQTLVEPIVAAPVKTTNEVIQEIHDTFYSEVDRLLDGTKVFRELQIEKQSLIDKSERLAKLGFINTPDVVEANRQLSVIAEKERLNETILYFQQKYPAYKFITEKSVKKICEKYGLIYSQVANYKGDVPDKNIHHIESFKVQDEDKCYARRFSMSDYTSDVGFSEVQKQKETDDFFTKNHHFPGVRQIFYSPSPLEIVAPVSDFKTEGMELRGFKLSAIPVPDPIVLQPVFHNGQKHYLIITAWGLEASDELVVNQKMN